VRYEVAQVAADPACVPVAGEPDGWPGLVYYRLHGRPRVYWSAYSQEFLDALTVSLRDRDGEVWCIFDNTASGAALEDAWQLQRQTRSGRSPQMSALDCLQTTGHASQTTGRCTTSLHAVGRR
jgi:uncharacterized protein YecE (DUF72 family)